MAAVSAQPALLSAQQLARLSGFNDADVTACQDAGLITPAGNGGFTAVELTKLQLLRQVVDSSGLPAALERYREGGYTLGSLEGYLPLALALSDLSYREACEQAGIPLAEYQALIRAAGLPDTDVDQPARIEDIEVLRGYAQLRQLPIALEERLHVLRLTADGMRRAAEAQMDLFRVYVEAPLLETHRDDPGQAHEAVGQLGALATPAIASLTGWLQKRVLEQEILRHVTEEMEQAINGEAPTPLRTGEPAVAFVDLAGFTVLSSTHGDAEAARIANRFGERVSDVVRGRGGRVVKSLGDGAMLLFTDACEAVRAGLELVTALPASGLPPVRVGINRGPLVAYAGDYFGSSVNLAARITDYARPREVLLAESVIPDGAEGVELEEIGEVTLKGVAAPVRLFRARPKP
jgi:class 3 adenylate cyclase